MDCSQARFIDQEHYIKIYLCKIYAFSIIRLLTYSLTCIKVCLFLIGQQERFCSEEFHNIKNVFKSIKKSKNIDLFCDKLCENLILNFY